MTVSTHRRIARVLLVATAVLAAGAVGRAADAADCPFEPIAESTLRSYEADLLRMLNRERRSRGIAEVAANGGLASIAREHARRLAAEGRLAHNESFLMHPEAVGARAVGEVTAYGGCTPDRPHEILMGSAAHRSTMLGGAWTEAGIGLASTDGGTLYVVEDFLEPAAQAPDPAPALAPLAPPPAPAAPASAPSRPADRPEPAQPATEDDTVPAPPAATVALGAAGFEPVTLVDPAARTARSFEPTVPAALGDPVIWAVVALLVASGTTLIVKPGPAVGARNVRKPPR